jgi:DNA polymerase
MDKQTQLEKIAKQIATCRECKAEKSGMPVAGEGNPNADIVFLGEAPGRTEAQTGRPFIGRSGQLLRKVIRDSGLQEEDVYITSPVKYLPDRGTPTKKHIAHGRMHLNKQLEVIQPKVIVLLGATAAYAILERVVPVMKEHGSLIKENGRTYLLTIHPAAVLRFPKYKDIMLSDFEKLKNLVGNKK